MVNAVSRHHVMMVQRYDRPIGVPTYVCGHTCVSMCIDVLGIPTNTVERLSHRRSL